MENILNKMLVEVVDDAVSVGFPVSKNLASNVFIDAKTYDRVGACYRYKYPERYEIHLSELAKKAHASEIKNIIAHEVLHANFLTMTHNCFWHMYKQLMNEKLGYAIKLNYSWGEILKQ